MPHNALQALLRNQPRVPQYTPDEEMLGPTDEELMQEQEEIGTAGAESGRQFYAVPSRESLRTSAMGQLRRVLGMQEREAEAKALPARIAGEYGLREAGVRTQGQMASAQAAASRLASQQQFQAEQNRLNREASADRATQTQQAIAGRAATQQRAAAERQRAAQRAQRIQGLQSGKTNMPVKPGVFAALGRFLGLSPSQEEVNQTEMQRLMAEETPGGGDDTDLLTIAQQIAEDFPGADLNSLIQQGLVEGSPEELAALDQMLRSLQP